MQIGLGISLTSTVVLNPPRDPFGPEMVTNGAGGAYIGNFTAGTTGFHNAAGAGWSFAGGKLTGNTGGGSMGVASHAGTIIGRTYRVTVTIDSISAGTGVRFFVGGRTSSVFTTPGQKEFDLVATVAGATWSQMGITNLSSNVVLDNWSVREVL